MKKSFALILAFFILILKLRDIHKFAYWFDICHIHLHLKYLQSISYWEKLPVEKINGV